MKSVTRSLIVMFGLMAVLMIGGCKDDGISSDQDKNDNETNSSMWPAAFTPGTNAFENTEYTRYGMFKNDAGDELFFYSYYGSGTDYLVYQNKARTEHFSADFVSKSSNEKTVTIKVDNIGDGILKGQQFDLCTNWTFDGSKLTLTSSETRLNGDWTKQDVM